MSEFKESMQVVFTEMDIDNITYRQWESTDRTELVTHNSNVPEFVDVLIEKLRLLKVHQFIRHIIPHLSEKSAHSL